MRIIVTIDLPDDIYFRIPTDIKDRLLNAIDADKDKNNSVKITIES